MKTEIWNKTGTVVGRLSRSDLIYLIRDSDEGEMRERIAVWLTILEGSDEFVVSCPFKGKGSPTIEE